MSSHVEVGTDLLAFKRDDLTLDDINTAMRAFMVLILTLESRVPPYTEFINYLIQAGHAKPEKGTRHVSPTLQ